MRLCMWNFCVLADANEGKTMIRCRESHLAVMTLVVRLELFII